MNSARERPARQPSFDRANWPPDAVPLASAGLALAFGAALWWAGGFWRIGALALAADTCVALLPWRHPRSERSTVSIWTETLGYLAGPAVLAVVAVASLQPWLGHRPAVGWWPVAVAEAAVLIWLGGVNLRALASGDLAFLAPAVTLRHKLARCVSVASLPPGEEVLYRAPLLAVHGLLALPLGVTGAAAFVARHHVAGGLHARTTRRMLLTQVAAAAMLGLTTWTCRSIYPALLAHALNNVPSFLLEAGRRTHAAARPEPASRQEALDVGGDGHLGATPVSTHRAAAAGEA